MLHGTEFAYAFRFLIEWQHRASLMELNYKQRYLTACVLIASTSIDIM